MDSIAAGSAPGRDSARMTEDQFLTIKDISVILKLAEKTVYSMAQDRELPAFKVRGQWRMRRVDFDKWIARQAKAATSARGAG
jgi:excisionase family DNA binding protein